MIKFLKNQKVFILLILALLTLATGLLFAMDALKVKETGIDAGTSTFTINYGIGYSNDPDETNFDTAGKSSVYYNRDGVKYNGTIITVTRSYVNAYTGRGTITEGSAQIKLVGEANDQQGHNDPYKSQFKYSYTSHLIWYDFKVTVTFTHTVAAGFDCRVSGSLSSALDGSTYKHVIEGGQKGSKGDENLIYYANYLIRPKRYTITLDNNGGNGSDSHSVIYYQKPTNISIPTKIGYNFNGYKIGEYIYWDSSGSYTGDAWKTANDATAVAQWAPIEYTITLDQQGGSGGTTQVNATYDATYPSITVPTRTGYTFLGYYTSASDGTQIYNSDGATDAKYDIADNTTLYAQWARNTYAITFDANGGSVSTSTKSVTFDSEVTALTNNQIASRTGYTFLGYYDAVSDGTQYFNESGVFVKANTWTEAIDKTLFAYWEENSYLITWNKNDGGEETKTSTVKYTDALPLLDQRFERIGYTQSSWGVADSHEVQFSETISIESLGSADYTSLDMYAIWEENWINKRSSTVSGAGTSSSPYQISTAEDLAWLAYKTNYLSTSNDYIYCEQKANIDLDETKWFPIGTLAKPFKGVYDGKGYSISNLNTTSIGHYAGISVNSYVGLFGNVTKKSDAETSEIKNVVLLAGEILGYEYVGGIVGNISNSKISNCQSYLTINAKYGQYVGGLVGKAENSEIENCYVNASVSGNSGTSVYYGGLIGDLKSSNVSSCGFEGDSSGRIFIGNNDAGTITDCFAVTTASGKAFIGGSSGVSSCLYISGTSKKCYSGTFTNWVIPSWVTSTSTTKTPLPSGLSWLATGGVKVTGISQITGLGYTAA